ncbi:MAG: hypothetical protein QG672_1730 [Pseudomonadota bacterium]|nr:hypothetical protein [Pseudomonadota bacterium]
MKVIALERGFFDGASRERGDSFEVPDGRKASWYAPAEEGAAKPKPKAKAKGGEPTTFSEIARTDSEAQAPKGADDLV